VDKLIETPVVATFLFVVLILLSILSRSVVMGYKDQEKGEGSLSGKVQANCWPVLPPVYPRQPGECAA